LKYFNSAIEVKATSKTKDGQIKENYKLFLAAITELGIEATYKIYYNNKGVLKEVYVEVDNLTKSKYFTFFEYLGISKELNWVYTGRSQYTGH